jgi:hypothetical protein
MQGFYMLGFRVASSVKPALETIDSRGISRPFAVTDSSFVEPLTDRRDGFLIIDITHGVDDLTREICAVEDPDSFALLNMSDTANFMDYDPRYRVFSAHQNRFATRRGTIYPMPFGMSQDLIIRTADARKVERRNGMVLSNFTPSLSQGVRNALSIMLEEPLAQQGKLDRGSWTEEEYLKKLSSASAILAYGGDFYRDLSTAEAFKENPQYRFKTFERDVVILRWDSWRLYEGIAAGCVPTLLCPSTYGFDLVAGDTMMSASPPLAHALLLSMSSHDMVESLYFSMGSISGFISKPHSSKYQPIDLAKLILGKD